MNNTAERIALVTLSTILLITGIAKFFAAINPEHGFDDPDPIFSFLRLRHTLLLAATLELSLVYLLISQVSPLVKWTNAATLVTLFAAYRLGRLLLGYTEPCSCVGNVVTYLPITPQQADDASKIILLVIGLVSYIYFAHRLRREWQSAPDSYTAHTR
jgi:hypothetical protein